MKPACVFGIFLFLLFNYTCKKEYDSTCLFPNYYEVMHAAKNITDFCPQVKYTLTNFKLQKWPTPCTAARHHTATFVFNGIKRNQPIIKVNLKNENHEKNLRDHLPGSCTA
jgi:hypothetical protein